MPSDGRRSIFPPSPASAAGDDGGGGEDGSGSCSGSGSFSGSGSARDLTRSPRARAMRGGEGGGGGIPAPVLSPDRPVPAYRGQSTARRRGKGGEASEEEEGEGLLGERGSPGAWALRHAAYLGTSGDDDDDEEEEVVGEEMAAGAGAVADGKAAAVLIALGEGGGGGAAIFSSSSSRASSQAGSDMGDTAPMSNLLPRPGGPGPGPSPSPSPPPQPPPPLRSSPPPTSQPPVPRGTPPPMPVPASSPPPGGMGIGMGMMGRGEGTAASSSAGGGSAGGRWHPVDLSPITPSWGEWGSVSEYGSLGGPHTPDEAALLAAGTGVGTGAEAGAGAGAGAPGLPHQPTLEGPGGPGGLALGGRRDSVGTGGTAFGADGLGDDGDGDGDGYGRAGRGEDGGGTAASHLLLDPSSSSLPTPPAAVPSDPTVHLQSLLLAVAFLFVWSPQNLMAPNLTQMADFFGFTPEQRDLYLGANVAFATGVLSLPVSAAIGFLADQVTSRRNLYAATCLVGGLSAILTGLSRTYAQLYFARFVCGGCMSGTVPVAFSLLGDLFDAKHRNAASSGLTAMMGGGMILGQMYAGFVGSRVGWRQPFYCSGVLTVLSSGLVLVFVREPVRGGKEKALQGMLQGGKKYDRKLTLHGFMQALFQNRSNSLLIWFGFVTSVPWGIIFVFLNDYLSQEQGMSVPDATFLVLWFGIGATCGGILGGYLGQLTVRHDRSYLPLFMAATTFLGMFPFLLLLNGPFHTAAPLACLYSFLGGCVANLPSVNVRPCIINVNPPETRGAALTAANLVINLSRGAGPSSITIMAAIWGLSRQFSFNLTLIVFWTIGSVQLFLLSRTLPADWDAMERDLAKYADSALGRKADHSAEESLTSDAGDEWSSLAGEESLVSIEDRITSFDVSAAKETLDYFGEAIQEVEVVLHGGRAHDSVPASIGQEQPRQWTSRRGYGHDLRRYASWRSSQQQRHQYEPINEESELLESSRET